jgi:hypothetical protein
LLLKNFKNNNLPLIIPKYNINKYGELSQYYPIAENLFRTSWTYVLGTGKFVFSGISSSR